MIRVLLFDIGGVLLQGKMVPALRELAASRGVDPETLAQLRAQHADEMRVGAFSVPALFRAAGMVGDDEALLASWLAFLRRHLTPNEALLVAMRQWRAKGVRTAILSNVSGLRTPLDEALGIYEGCDPVLLSHQLGVMKPNPAAYVAAVERIGVPAGEIVFIDDTEANLPPARAAGMHAVRFTDNLTLVHDLAGFGIS